MENVYLTEKARVWNAISLLAEIDPDSSEAIEHDGYNEIMGFLCDWHKAVLTQ